MFSVIGSLTSNLQGVCHRVCNVIHGITDFGRLGVPEVFQPERRGHLLLLFCVKLLASALQGEVCWWSDMRRANQTRFSESAMRPPFPLDIFSGQWDQHGSVMGH